MLFHRAIEKADKVEDIPGRISALTESITHAVFLYTSQALFEKDKLTFLSQMAFQVRKSVPEKQPQNPSLASLCIRHFTAAWKCLDSLSFPVGTWAYVSLVSRSAYSGLGGFALGATTSAITL